LFAAQAQADPKGAAKYLQQEMIARRKAALTGRKASVAKPFEGLDTDTKTAIWAAGITDPNDPRLADPKFRQTLVRQADASRTSRAPSSTIVVPGAKKAAESLASPIGARAEASLSLAEGAAETMTNANMIRQALDKGLVIAGPAAGLRMKWAQLQNLAGVGNPEQLQQTRNTIQGLAALTLDSRASLKGQGQITEGETKLLERARSGNIEDMTVEELQIVVDVSQRLASRQWQRHEQLLNVMRDDPNAAASFRYYVPSVQLPQPVGRKGAANKQPQAPAAFNMQPAPSTGGAKKPSVSNW
jgi:hypothetical protein